MGVKLVCTKEYKTKTMYLEEQVSFIPSRPSSMSSRAKMGIVESVRGSSFFLSEVFPSLVLLLGLRGPQQKSMQMFLIFFPSFGGGSYPYSACLRNTHPVPTYTGP